MSERNPQSHLYHREVMNVNYWQAKLRDAEQERDAARRELEEVLIVEEVTHRCTCEGCPGYEEMPPESGAYDDGHEAGYEVGYSVGYKEGHGAALIAMLGKITKLAALFR